MNKLFTKIATAFVGMAMAIGVGVGLSRNSDVKAVRATTVGTTYDVNATAATSITNNGLYVLKCNNSSDGFDGTISSNWGGMTTTASNYFILKAVGSASGFTLEDYDGTNGYIYCSAAKKMSWSASQSTTFTLMDGKTTTTISNAVGNNTVGTLQKGASGIRPYTTGTGADFQLFSVSLTSIPAYVAGDSSINVGNEYTATVKKTSDDSAVAGTITYVYTPSNGAVLSSPTPDGEGKGTNTTGRFTASNAGTITVSATLSGYTIASKAVTINANTPYINLTLTSSASAYTGQTVTITSEYGNGVAGLNWSVQSGSVTNASGTNSGYSAKIAGTTGTLTIRATDTGNATYSEVSVSVTKTAFTTSPVASASVAEGKTTTLSAVLNSGGTVNWESDDPDVATVSAGVVTGIAEGSTTIIVTSADDNSVFAECEITVTEAPSEIEITYASYSSNLPASGYDTVDWSANGVSGKINSIKQTGTNTAVQLKNNQSFIYNSVAISGYITSITITKYSGSNRNLTAWVSTSAMDSNPAEGGDTKSSSWSWSFDSNDHYTFFRIANTGDGAFYADSIVVGYEKVAKVDPTGITLNNSNPITMDTYGYGRRQLIATVEPFNNNDSTVNWGTTDPSVVTISNGILTAVGTGNAYVYATTGNYVSDVATPGLKTSVSVTVNQALYKKATFVPTSSSTASQGDDYLNSGSVTVSTTGSFNTEKALNSIQLSGSKSATFTISGYEGMKITGVDLIMSSNSGAGTGALTVTAGTTEILEIESAGFNDASWNGAYNASPCDLYKATSDYVVAKNEDIIFSFSCSVNSLFIHSVAIRYLDYSLEQWCQSFIDTFTCSGVDQEHPNGAITVANPTDVWDDFGLAFLAIEDDDLKDLAKTATANPNGTVIEQALARYDLVIRKYGSGTYDDFIGRFKEGGANYGSRIINGLTANTTAQTSIIIVVTSLVGIIAVGAFFFIRKRKED